MEFKHYSVMLKECIEQLQLKPGGIYYDGTLGGGGHSERILERTGPNGVVIGVDRDSAAIRAAKARLARFGERLIAVNDNFKNIDEILNAQRIDKLDGAILDLGVSSYQLDNFDRGFSYRATDAPLDMRMDEAQSFSAYNVINDYPQDKLMKVFYEYGEEKFSRRIAEHIVRARQAAPIKTCGELTDVIVASIPAAARRSGGHPAKRVYQAVRIEVNRELEELDKAVTAIAMRLSPGARFCVLTFHSLEDRIVKHTFKNLELNCICDRSAPICVCGKRREVKIITTKPVTAAETELAENSRSESAKLRVAERM